MRWRRSVRRQFECHVHCIPSGAVPVGGDGVDDEAESGIERLRVLAGAERDALGAECSCAGHPRVGELCAQALAMTGAVDHAPAEGGGVFVVQGEATAGDDKAVVVDHEVVVGAVRVEQVGGEVLAFVWGEVTRHVGVEQREAGGGVCWGVGAEGGHGGDFGMLRVGVVGFGCRLAASLGLLGASMHPALPR